MIEAEESDRIILEGMRSSLKKKIEILRDAISDLKRNKQEIPKDLFAKKNKFEKELEKLKS